MMVAMTDEGAHVKTRRERLRMDRIELAREASVSVDTLRDLEEGTTANPRGSTVAKITSALTELEKEAGLTGVPVHSVEPSGLMEFEVTGDFGVRVVVKGPVSDAAELEAAVARLVRDIRASGQAEGNNPE